MKKTFVDETGFDQIQKKIYRGNEVKGTTF